MSRPRIYSRYGCSACKRRKKKCDEQRPVCAACQRLNLTCIWETPSSRRPSGSSTRTLTPPQQSIASIAVHRPPLSPRIRPRITPRELYQIDFFHNKTLPLLQLCQPSIDWPGLLGSYMHRSTACRNIVTALGTQQRWLTSSDDALALDADVAYQYALSSWRTTLPYCGSAEAPMVVFGCVLLIILESMRESTDGLQTHLKVAVKMCNTLKLSSINHHISGFFGLLQTLCTSTRLHEVSPFGSHAPEQSTKLNHNLQVAYRDGDLQFATQSAIANLIQLRASQSRSVIDALPYDHIAFQLLARQLKAESVDLYQDNPYSIANHANAVLFDITLKAGPQGDVRAPEEAFTPFECVIALLERCMALLKAGARSSQLPFALGLDITQKLDLILAASRSESVRRKALRLLSCAPAHEGLWIAGSVESYRSSNG